MHPPAPRAFPKSARVRTRRDFLAIQGGGRKLHTDSFLVFVAPGPSGGKRLGITVSKRVGNAVVRNRVKRLVREIYRLRQAAFPVGADVVFVAKRSAAELEFARADQEVERLCARAFRR